MASGTENARASLSCLPALANRGRTPCQSHSHLSKERKAKERKSVCRDCATVRRKEPFGFGAAMVFEPSTGRVGRRGISQLFLDDR